jgi:hypothetical protein
VADGRLSVPQDAPSVEIARCRQGGRLTCLAHRLRAITAASGYQMDEWAVDHWFGQHLFIAETDTVTDLADGFLGGAIGGVFLGVGAMP